jgi:hypothetical protein
MTPFVRYTFRDLQGEVHEYLFIPHDPSQTSKSPEKGEYEKLLQKYHKGDTIVVRYLRSRPSDSEVESEVQAMIQELRQDKQTAAIWLAIVLSPILIVFIISVWAELSPRHQQPLQCSRGLPKGPPSPASVPDTTELQYEPDAKPDSPRPTPCEETAPVAQPERSASQEPGQPVHSPHADLSAQGPIPATAHLNKEET